MRLLVHLSGEHPRLPEAELRAVLAADGIAWDDLARHDRLLVGEVDATPAAVASSVSRLAMTHEVVRHRATMERSVAGLTVGAEALPPDLVPDGATFAVRALSAGGDPNAGGPPGRGAVEAALGRVIGARAHVDLDGPEVVLRAWLTGHVVHVGEVLWSNDRGAFEARGTKERPFFSPVSGHPRWMRAIVNLAANAPPDVVYDPLCGTGGILLEAALAGHRAIGSDIDPRMVAGSLENLMHYGVHGAIVFPCDVREAPARFASAGGMPAPGCIVTDLPYGQSASTAGVAPRDVARWTLEAIAALLPVGHRAVVGVADTAWLENLPSGLVAEDRFALRVHKSLTRTYVLLCRLG